MQVCVCKFAAEKKDAISGQGGGKSRTGLAFKDDKGVVRGLDETEVSLHRGMIHGEGMEEIVVEVAVRGRM